MPKWTDEQLLAIEKENTNIIVSAGAGSGKTAVLTERVIRKLKSGISIDRLLVLTFTKAAAEEMKNRIRDKIKLDESIKPELDKIDGAYINTFDSFALFIVKKYHYLLNITSNVKISDSSILSVDKTRILDEMFDEFYKKNDLSFEKMISDFCVKDDSDIKKMILNINSKLDMKYDKDIYLKNYLENNFNDDKINNDIKEYFNLIKQKIDSINDLCIDLSNYVENDYYVEFSNILNPLLNSSNYDEVKNSLGIKLKNLPRGSGDDAKKVKDNINGLLKEIKILCVYDDESFIKNSILETYDYVKTIINILIILDERINNYKRENNLFEFVDISKLAIKVVEENNDIREELKEYFNEILVDEYQDTSDLQEIFINLIGNNNIYMVGDIKQSIYRFRNANPNIFKEKYISYGNNIGGFKIDLNKNFRSRKEVLNNINNIFDKIMDNYIGGAEYSLSHRMIFGNTNFSIFKKEEQNNDIEIYNYEKQDKYLKEEVEAFIIANDIKEKINNKYQVMDKDGLRDSTYKDFSILIDRSTSFDLYKKIFEYLNIPLTIYKDDVINESFDIRIIYNILNLICKTYNKEYDVEFKYSFVSVLRSFLFNLSDEEIFNYIANNKFFESDLMKLINELVKDFDNLTIDKLFDLIIDKFDYYNNLIKVGNINNSIKRIDYLNDLFCNMGNMGFDIIKSCNYLNNILEIGYELRSSNTVMDDNSVKIMTIHKSKGLEYNVCYLPSLYSKFNISDLKDKFVYDNTYGIITPYFNNGISSTIYKSLLKNKYMVDEISEKIRLFYVAVTRSREKIILINSFDEDKTSLKNNSGVVVNNDRLKYNSFSSILNSIQDDLTLYRKNVNIEEINISRDYSVIKNNNYTDLIKPCLEKLNNVDISLDKNIIKNESFSKKTNKLLEGNTVEMIKLGNKFHYTLELLDLKNPNTNVIEDKFIKEKIESFLNCDLLKDINSSNIYHEYEFMYDKDNVNYHGIIDLMIEKDNSIDIIDYKLNNIDDDLYIKQLNGYRDYICNKTSKVVNCYLYSIIKEKYKKI